VLNVNHGLAGGPSTSQDEGSGVFDQGFGIQFLMAARMLWLDSLEGCRNGWRLGHVRRRHFWKRVFPTARQCRSDPKNESVSMGRETVGHREKDLRDIEGCSDGYSRHGVVMFVLGFQNHGAAGILDSGDAQSPADK
jgi:hypothetical protein